MNVFIYKIGCVFVGALAIAALTAAIIGLLLLWKVIMEETYAQVRNTYYLIVFKRVCRISKRRQNKRLLRNAIK